MKSERTRRREEGWRVVSVSKGGRRERERRRRESRGDRRALVVGFEEKYASVGCVGGVGTGGSHGRSSRKRRSRVASSSSLKVSPKSIERDRVSSTPLSICLSSFSILRSEIRRRIPLRSVL